MSNLLDDPAFLADLKSDLSGRQVADRWPVSKSTVNDWRARLERKDGRPTKEKIAAVKAEGRYRFDDDGTTVHLDTHATTVPQTHADVEQAFRDEGLDPADFDLTIRRSKWENGAVEDDGELRVLHACSVTAKRRPELGSDTGPAWPVIQPGQPLVIKPLTFTPRNRKWKTAVLMADTQIGFRRYEDGTLEPFHDEAAMSVALQIVQVENPDRTVVMGDIVDMAEQGRFAQEAAFANTTQPALDRTTEFGGQMRCATNGLIDWIEGNHDLRLQTFVEANAKAAFGLRKGGMPESWPVMSLPNLLRLDETGITYHDAYPAAHVWINNVLRCEHGTKVNSNGSTVAKYANETPHISTASGHTHRQEAQGKTTFDRMGKIVSMHINPGCLCRVDGTVPSKKGAIGANGHPAEMFEDWQQGVAVVRYLDDDFRVQLVQIQDGMTFYDKQEIWAV